MSVVNVEICSRMPSFSASARRQVGARSASGAATRGATDAAAAAAIDVGGPAAVDGEPGTRGPHAHLLPVDDEAGVDGARTPRREHRLDRLGDRAGRRRRGSSRPSGRKRSELREPGGASAPTSSPLSASVDGLVDSEVASSTRGLLPPTSSARARRASVQATASARRSATPSRATLHQRRASTPSPGRAGMTGRARLGPRTCARRGFGSAADTRAATSSTLGTRDEHRVDDARSAGSGRRACATRVDEAGRGRHSQSGLLRSRRRRRGAPRPA